ncbi:hypothetical protein [Bergeyella sp. RCAD1439]|uniref:hypothetical protein n=1 Tax=Bergeyella anatis TaxID=3113737 RepID=UPI002E1829AB|nr:hypothetical protein [Bergeyella sp. RCAD1439]
MESFVFFVFLLLGLGVLASAFRTGAYARQARWFRLGVLLVSFLYFSYWFVQKSTERFQQDSMAVQIINKLPQPVDFYVIKIKKGTKVSTERFEMMHVGRIRPEHYRLEYLRMDNSDEYWLAGYIGKRNLAYFSQHYVPNKNMDQILEIHSFINQSVRLSETASRQVDRYRAEHMSLSVWVTLSFLLMFLNMMLFFMKK